MVKSKPNVGSQKTPSGTPKLRANPGKVQKQGKAKIRQIPGKHLLAAEDVVPSNQYGVETAASTSSTSQCIPNTTTTWMKFFRDAGIPPQVAGNYAVLFADHRIQTDMLQDLSRDILQAMGVTVMGDIIAILKHAKQKYEQVTREKALGNEMQLSSKPILEPRRPIQVSSGPIHVSTRPQVSDLPVEISPIRTSTPASRILDRLTQQANSPRIGTPRANNSKAAISRLSLPPRRSNSELMPRQSRTVISLKRKEEIPEEVPVKKVRRVLPEHEGRYNIKMPVGITPKTRRLLEQQNIVSPKTSVFSRLGDPKVSSTTGNGSEGTKITVTNFGRSVAQPKIISLKNSSVFDRLGPGKSQVSSTSVDEDDLLQYPRGMLQYQGVLKSDQRQTPTATIGPMKVSTKKLTVVTTTKRSGILARLGPQASSLNSLGVKKVVGPPTSRLKMAAPANRLVVRKAQSSGLKSDGILASGNKTRLVPLKNRLGPKTIAVRQAASVRMMRGITNKKINPIATLTTGRKLRLVNKQISTRTNGGIFSRLGQVQP